MYARVLFIRQCKYTQFFKKYVFFIFVDLSEVLKSNLKTLHPILTQQPTLASAQVSLFVCGSGEGAEVSVLSSC